MAAGGDVDLATVRALASAGAEAGSSCRQESVGLVL